MDVLLMMLGIIAGVVGILFFSMTSGTLGSLAGVVCGVLAIGLFFAGVVVNHFKHTNRR